MPSAAMLSQERIQDSSDDESSRSPEVAAQGSKSTSSGAEKKSKTNLSKLNSGANEMLSDESDASESSSKSSSSSQSAGSKRKAIEPAKTTSNPPSKKSKTDLAKVKRVESPRYVPPQGYTANKMQPSEMSSQVQNIFKDLEGKQIWHISAPASFPISKLESLNVQTALNGEPVLQHKGISYTMSRGDNGETALLTPKPNGDYVRTAAVNRTFNIRGSSDTTTRVEDGTTEDSALSQTNQRDESGATSSNPGVFFATRTGQRKAPRKQPENLKARYVPYGVVAEAVQTENEDAQDDDVQMADVSPEPKEPTQSTPKSSKKSKVKMAHSPEVIVEETPSKRKKEKHAVSSSQGELPVSESSQKKKKERSKK